MRTTLKHAFTFLLGFCAATLGAQPTSGYTRFLIPVYVNDTPGAYGSLWRSETWVRYSGTETMRMAPRPYECADCPIGGAVEPDWPSLRVPYLAGYPEPAILAHVESQHVSAVTFASRIRDLSRAGLSGGTQIPVVREDRMSLGALYLLNIPIEPRFRQTLRVYALPDVEQPEVEVRYFRQPDGSGPGLDLNIYLLRAERVALRSRPSTAQFNLYPAIAEIGNVETFPELAGESAIWVEIVPITPGLRIWGLVSITNNENQQVTIISPQG
jgi:hypothetical protein